MDFGRATRGWRPPTPQKPASSSQDPHLPTLLRIQRSAIIITPPWQTNRAQSRRERVRSVDRSPCMVYYVYILRLLIRAQLMR
eukprot:COSAG01_NODE_671_length_14345_cov_229.934728_7_plen_83_part_00